MQNPIAPVRQQLEPPATDTVPVPLSILFNAEVPRAARLVWTALADSVGRTLAEMAGALGMSASTFKLHAAWLCDRGYATARGGANGNVYTVHTEPIPPELRHRDTVGVPGEPVALYRYFDAADRLLYVGISRDPFTRAEQHANTAGWHRQARRSTIEWHPNRAEALAAELGAIRTENPAHNIAGFR